MATNANNRAARRSAVTAARRTAAQRIDAADVLDDVMVDAPQSPVEEPQALATPRTRLEGQPPADQTPSRPAQPLAPRGNNASGSSVMLPMADRSRQLEAGDLVIPKLKISQGLSAVSKLYASSRGKEGIPAGTWYYTMGNREIGDTVFFIPCDMRKSRSLFEQGTGVVCRSFDLLRGEGNPGGLCEGTQEEMYSMPEQDRGCELRLWRRTLSGNIPPRCGINYNYTGLIIIDPRNPDTSEVLQGMLQLRSTGVNAAKQINTGVLTFAGGNWAQAIFELRVDSRTNTKGEFFLPVADFYDTTEATGWERIARRANAFARQMGQADLRSSIESDPDTAD
jgi:hypothetical protein